MYKREKMRNENENENEKTKWFCVECTIKQHKKQINKYNIHIPLHFKWIGNKKILLTTL